MMRKLNGIVFTGGNTLLCEDGHLSKWSRQVKRIFDLALQFNDQGIYYPIWGSCQGLEIMSILVAQDCSILTSSSAVFYPSSVTYTSEVHESRMLADFDPRILSMSSQERFTFNNHGFGVTATTFKNNSKLTSFFSLLATSDDSEEQTQIAIIEARNYPVYATIFHPESVFSSFTSPAVYSRSVETIEYSQSFFRFFVSESSKNSHTMNNTEFLSLDIENKPLTLIEIKLPTLRLQSEAYLYK